MKRLLILLLTLALAFAFFGCKEDISESTPEPSESMHLSASSTAADESTEDSEVGTSESSIGNDSSETVRLEAPDNDKVLYNPEKIEYEIENGADQKFHEQKNNTGNYVYKYLEENEVTEDYYFYVRITDESNDPEYYMDMFDVANHVGLIIDESAPNKKSVVTGYCSPESYEKLCETDWNIELAWLNEPEA